MNIIFDVGANHGTDSLPIVARNADTVCFAFEPTPYLINLLQQRSQSLNISDRYHIIPYAVSNFDGEANFHIAGQADWGCSSLLEFSEKSKTHWPGRTDFKVTETIKTKVITLKTFIEQMSPLVIDTIHYFHCDTQGSDLKVLIGMGEHISLIEKGVVEAATYDNILYHNQNTVYDTEKYLQQSGFKTSVLADGNGNESNIRFTK